MALVFRISSQGTETTLYRSLEASPLTANSRKLDWCWVVTRISTGRPNTAGRATRATVFRISPSGNFTNLYSFFPTGNEGAYPVAGLVEGSDLAISMGRRQKAALKSYFGLVPAATLHESFTLPPTRSKRPQPHQLHASAGHRWQFLRDDRIRGDGQQRHRLQTFHPPQPAAQSSFSVPLVGHQRSPDHPLDLRALLTNCSFINSLGSAADGINVGSPVTQ